MAVLCCLIHVTLPAMNTDPSEFEKRFVIADYTRCIDSSDTSHTGMLTCASWA